MNIYLLGSPFGPNFIGFSRRACPTETDTAPDKFITLSASQIEQIPPFIPPLMERLFIWTMFLLSLLMRLHLLVAHLTIMKGQFRFIIMLVLLLHFK